MASADELLLLSRYAAGELPVPEAAELERSLYSRPELGEALSRLRALDQATAALREADATVPSDAQLAELIAGVPRPAEATAALTLSPWFAFGGGAGLVAALALTTFLVWRADRPVEVFDVRGEVTLNSEPIEPAAPPRRLGVTAA